MKNKDPKPKPGRILFLLSAGDPLRDPDKLPRIIDPAGLIVIGLELIKELSGRNQESSRCRNAAIVCRFCYHLIIISFRTAQEPQKQP